MRMLAMILAVLTLSTGYAQETQTQALSGSPLVDHWIKAKWADAELKAAKSADDAEWMRRVHLDVVGCVPSLEEVEKHLADKSTGKRAALVDRLVKDPRYADHWADVWSGVIVGFDKDQRAQGARNVGAQDLHEMLEKNLPYDEFARRVITVEGWVTEGYGAMMMDDKDDKKEEPVGLASYVVRQFREAGKDLPKSLAGKLSRSFMGVQIQCAQCHDHPFDKWTQEQFYGMASFFTELQVRRDPQDSKSRGYTVSDRERGPIAKKMAGGTDLSIPETKSAPIKPSFLTSEKGAVSSEKRRVSFAKYMTEPENVQFARMAVNRYWAHFFGAGIVNPVDDFNEKNKPTHPELLDALAKDFIAHKYDLHWLIKTLAGSEAYGLTSRLGSKDRDPAAEKYLALHRVRALAPEQIMRSVIEAAQLDEGMLGRRFLGRGPDAGGKGPKMPAGKGPAAKGAGVMMLTSQFRNTFEDDEGSESVDFAGTIPSALLMMNNPQLSTGMSANRLTGFGDLMAKRVSVEDKIRAIFLSCLGRAPSTGEMNRWKSHAARTTGVAAYEDCLWTLLNTSEFLFNH